LKTTIEAFASKAIQQISVKDARRYARGLPRRLLSLFKSRSPTPAFIIEDQIEDRSIDTTTTNNHPLHNTP
jgi:hypothetical protein